MTIRCTCGFTGFSERLHLFQTPSATRWRPAGYADTSGLGSVPLGLALGSGSVSRWGHIEVAVTTGRLELCCDACGRMRSYKDVGGGTVLGAWQVDFAIYALMSDVVTPACMTARFVGSDRTVEVPIGVVGVTIPAFPAPLGTADRPPDGAIVGDTVYEVQIPDDLEGEYRLLFVDSCLRTTQYVMDVVVGGLVSVYGRSGNVTAMFGDYRASQIAVTVGGNLGARLEHLWVEANKCFTESTEANGDVSGSYWGFKIIGIQGRPAHYLVGGTPGTLQPAFHTYGASSNNAPRWYRWSAARQRWEASI